VKATLNCKQMALTLALVGGSRDATRNHIASQALLHLTDSEDTTNVHPLARGNSPQLISLLLEDSMKDSIVLVARLSRPPVALSSFICLKPSRTNNMRSNRSRPLLERPLNDDVRASGRHWSLCATLGAATNINSPRKTDRERETSLPDFKFERSEIVCLSGPDP